MKRGKTPKAGGKQRKRAVSARKRGAIPVPTTNLEHLVALAGDWYWEQDTEYRFTRIESQGVAPGEGADATDLIGKQRWEIGLEILAPGGWDMHRALLAERQPFRDIVFRRLLPDETYRYISVSGAPLFDRAKRFFGYSGIGKDITQDKQRDEELWRFRAAIDMSGDPIYVVDRATLRFVDFNETACRQSGYSREELLKRGPLDVLKADRTELERLYDAIIAKGDEGIATEALGRSKDGRAAWVEVHRRPLRMGDKWLIVSIARDITERKKMQRAAQRQGNMYAALSATNEAILRAESSEELYQRVCDAAVNGGKFLTTAVLTPGPESTWMQIAAATGANAEQLRNARISIDAATPEGNGLVGSAFRNLTCCVSNDFLQDERTQLWHNGATKAGVKSGAAVPLTHGGHAIGVLLLYSSEKNAFDEEVAKLLERMAENIAFALDTFDLETERKRAEERVQYLATHDSLTGLPNRAMFGQLLGHAIQFAKRYERQFAVLFIDLDRFKVVNDSLGHGAGDKLLQEISSRLTHTLRASDVVARLGGDEFVVLVQEITEQNQAAIVARKIISAVLQPIQLAGQECRVTASVGISMFPTDAEDEPTLMKQADMAMYFAKSEGKNNYQFYSKEIKIQSIERLALETSLRGALEHNELSLHYQAKVDVKSGRITGVEALLRWHSPTLGDVPPVQFIPIAEETGLIVPIGRWVLKMACLQNVAWQRQGLPAVCLAVNLSARQFTDNDLLRDIDAALQESGMAPELLELELTEGMVMQNPERAVQLLRAIKAKGVRLAIDDFGTGYSSLSQIKRFPIDTLKVDRSFIRELHNDAEDRAITEAIIAMGRTLSLTVVAEGVETEEQATFLRERACDEMQGYFFSRPAPPEHFADLLSHHVAVPSAQQPSPAA